MTALRAILIPPAMLLCVAIIWGLVPLIWVRDYLRLCRAVGRDVEWWEEQW